MNNCYRYCLKDLTYSQYLFIFLILIKSVTQEDAWREWKESACINQKQRYEIKLIRIKVSFVSRLLSTFPFPPCLFVCQMEGTELLFSSWGKQRGGFCSWYRGPLCIWVLRTVLCFQRALVFVLPPTQLSHSSSLGLCPVQNPPFAEVILTTVHSLVWVTASPRDGQPRWGGKAVRAEVGGIARVSCAFVHSKIPGVEIQPWHSKAKLSSLAPVPCPTDRVMFIYGSSCEFVGVPWRW